MNAEILSVGDELTLGIVVDTNSAYLSERLAAIGVRVAYHASVGDVAAELEAALRTACTRVPLVIVTGGLGPTRDDITRQAIARVAGKELRLHEPSLAQIRQRFCNRGVPMPESNEVQALIPEGATVLPNTRGTAPGFLVTVGECLVAALPGVPSEMKAMFEAAVRPALLERSGGGTVLVTRKLRSYGLPESLVNEKVGHLMEAGANPAIGLLAENAIISVKITARGQDQSEARALIDGAADRVRAILGEALFGADEDTLEGAVARLLEARPQTLAVAESCTGGLICDRLTNVPGISRFLLAGLVTYSNEAKSELLGVAPERFAEVGAVSAEVCEAMANGARSRCQADLGLAVTGIAGPSGGSPTKPVGLTYIGLATEAGTDVKERRFAGSREQVKDRTAKAALNMVRTFLLRRA